MRNQVPRAQWVLRAIAALASLSVSAVTLCAADGAAGFQERAYHDSAGDHKYMVFVPAGYTPERKWPVILYLHGSSARGTDNKLPLVGGLAPQVRARAATFPFLVVFPQCEDRDSRLLDGWLAGTPDAIRAIKILDAVENEFNVDRGQEILTGWSMGGAGAWSLAAENPTRWSALVIVAGTGDPATAPRLTRLPIWAFHGDRDFTVPFDEDRRMVTAVRDAGGRAYFTELLKVRHNIAHVVYGDDRLYEWMLDPKSEPKPESIVRNAERAPNESEMGHDFVHPFVPAAEIPQALYVRLDKDAIESLTYALPDLVPADALAGNGPDVFQTQRAFMTQFNITLSGINYRGTLERVAVTPHNDGWVDIALGVRNMTMEIGSTQIAGGLLRATAGPMQIVLGHQAPVYLTLKLRPYIENRRLRMELGGADFKIPDDNWYVTTPQVEARGLPFIRRRIASALSQRLVTGTYQHKSDIESRATASLPALVAKLEEQLNAKVTQTRVLGSWPMPAYQPPFRLWPDRLQIDETGLSLLVGITVGRPALDTSTRPLRRIERPQVNFADMPKGSGLQLGVSGAFLEGFTAVVVDAGVAMADALDLHAPEFHALSDRQNLIETIPDLARFGDQLQVRTRIPAVLEPMIFSGIDDDPDASGPKKLQTQVRLRMPHVCVTVEYKGSPEQAQWRRCAQFDLSLEQQFVLRMQRPNFESRFIRLTWPTEAQIAMTGRLDDSYLAVDPTLRTERLLELFRTGWKAAERMELLQQVSASDLSIGTATLRPSEVGWLEPYLIRRYVPARTRITNSGPDSLVYTIRGPFSEWGGPFTLRSGESHDYPVPYRVTIRPGGGTPSDMITIPMGKNYIFGPEFDPFAAKAPNLATRPLGLQQRQ